MEPYASTHDVNKIIITKQTGTYILEEGKKNHRSVWILSCFLNRTWKCCFRSNTCSILETKWWIECVHYDNTHVDTGEYTLHWTCKRLYCMWQKHSFHMEPVTQPWICLLVVPCECNRWTYNAYSIQFTLDAHQKCITTSFMWTYLNNAL